MNVVSIQRGPRLIAIPGAHQRLYPGDVIGVIGTDEQLQSMLPEVEMPLPEGESDSEVKLTSVLLSDSSPLVGATPRSSSLRASYDAIVVAVQREGEYIDSQPDLVFRSGDLVWLVGNPYKIAGLKFGK